MATMKKVRKVKHKMRALGCMLVLVGLALAINKVRRDHQCGVDVLWIASGDRWISDNESGPASQSFCFSTAAVLLSPPPLKRARDSSDAYRGLEFTK